jgi:nucleotide-binding universal stress UspA family protein
MERSSRSILVGYDDTSAAMAAVRWAAELARDTGAGIRLVHAWTWPLLGQGVAGIPVIDPAGPRNQASRLLDDVVDRITAQHPEVPVSAELVAGMPREVLEEASPGADLLVVGTRGLGAVLGTLLGSVSRGLLHDAGCPVAIIRSDQHRAGPVLVAYDGSPTAGEAVDVATDLAATWGTALRVVHVRTSGPASSRAEGGAGEERVRAQALLDEGAARARARRADVEVRSRMLEDRTAAEGLLDAAAGARMLVLGHRGLSRGRFGSTAHATVLHATGNVTVVRPAASGTTGTTGSAE